MMIKNVSLRPWNVMGSYIVPGATVDVACTEADVAGNADLEVVTPKAKPGPKPQAKETDGNPT